MVLEYPGKYLKCKCGGSLHLFEHDTNILLNENGDKRMQVFIYQCIRCKRRYCRSFEQVPEEIERAQWILEELHLQEIGEVEPFESN